MTHEHPFTKAYNGLREGDNALTHDDIARLLGMSVPGLHKVLGRCAGTTRVVVNTLTLKAISDLFGPEVARGFTGTEYGRKPGQVNVVAPRISLTVNVTVAICGGCNTSPAISGACFC